MLPRTVRRRQGIHRLQPVLKHKAADEKLARIAMLLRALPCQHNSACCVVKSGSGLPGHMLTLRRSRYVGNKLEALVHNLQQPLPEGLRQLGRLCNFLQQQGMQCFMRPGFAYGTPDDINRIDVARAFPKYADVRIPDQPGIDPLFNVAIAATGLHGGAGSRDGIAASPEFDERCQNSYELRGLFIAGTRQVHVLRCQH